ncbi:hypothetical protein [Chamaesiphon sp. VAR_69_metabat_338]|uniref:hypothetical protein n=1 Tax=Chamaesiphon sp. VAR_69_metabat_338 TaxID=2964704 RepID=UPI00286DC4C2|nr:hypothetical protein [Chamaesiphon sp. VAR_69_metabat_338]
MSNAVNDLGDNNLFDNRRDTDAEIARQASSSLDSDAAVPTGDLSVTAEVSANLPQVAPSSTPVRYPDPERQWLRDALASISAIPETANQSLGTDATLSELANLDRDPLPLDRSHADVNVELDLLLGSLQIATPQPPQSGSAVTVNSIDRIPSRISTVEPVTHSQQLLQELNDARSQLTAAQTILQLLNRRNQAQIDRVDAHTQEVKQIKFHTQQLALYSKSQVEIVRELLDAFDRIRLEIVATLDRVGGYEQIRELSVRLETARQNLLTASNTVTATLGERVAAERAAFDAELQSLQREVADDRDRSAAKLRQYQESVESLAQTIGADRLQTMEMSAKLTEIDSLEDRLTVMHDRVVQKSQTLESKISQIERGFGELSQSIQSEKEQFYALTVETIEKADLLRSHLTQIANQIDDDRAMISQLRAEVAQIDRSIPTQIERQLDSALNVRDRELLAICDDLQARHRQGVATIKKLSNWLWILSVTVGAISILSICIAISFKRAALF